MFETIKSIVGDVFSGPIKDQRIALSHEQLALLEKKITVLSQERGVALSEASKSKVRILELEKENGELKAELHQLRGKIKPVKKGDGGDQQFGAGGIPNL